MCDWDKIYSDFEYFNMKNIKNKISKCSPRSKQLRDNPSRKGNNRKPMMTCSLRLLQGQITHRIILQLAEQKTTIQRV
jgi:hypothetical protein